MPTYRPLRLQKTINKIIGQDASLFAVYTDQTGPIYGDTIARISITHGKASRGGGIHPSLAEITFKGEVAPSITGQNLRVFLRDVPAQRLSTYLGGAHDATSIAMRFAGRVGTIDIEDTHKRKITTLRASSWIARQLLQKTRTVTPKAGDSIQSLILDVSGMTAENRPSGLNIIPNGNFETIARPMEPMTFSDVEQKFGQDLGITFLQARSGVTYASTADFRHDDALQKAKTWLHLARSQAISPATWKQANEYPPFSITYSVTDSRGVVVTRTPTPITGPEPTFENQHIDWSWLFSQSAGTSGQPYREAYGRMHEASTRAFTLESITIDLLMLMTSPYRYHQLVALQILAMNVGDPVFIAGDWPRPVQGTYFAEEIKEEITPTAWRFTFSLARFSHITGRTDEPDITPRIWAAATGTWGENTLTWKDA